MAETNITLHRITGSLSKIGGLTGSLSIPKQIPVEEYTGAYEITPNWQEQRLMTEGKKMKKDIMIEKIPIFKSTNPSGGTTVIIGG